MDFTDLITIFSLFITIILYYMDRKKKNLTFQELQNSSALSMNKDLNDKIEIKYGDKSVDNLFVLKMKIKNRGSSPIKNSDILKPIELSFGKAFLECICIENPKGITVDLNYGVDNKSIYCNFDLLNPRDYFTLQFVSLEKLSTPIINSRIEGLSKVKIISNSGKGRLFLNILPNIELIKEVVILIFVGLFFGIIMDSFDAGMGLVVMVAGVYVLLKLGFRLLHM